MRQPFWKILNDDARFVARRFPKSEIEALWEMQDLWRTEGNYKKKLQRYYPNHSLWLERADSGLRKGTNRAALGLFVMGVDEDSRASYRPAASVVLGYSPLAPNNIELKSFLVDADLAREVLSVSKPSRHAGVSKKQSAANAKFALLDYARLYCALRGFQELEIEVPADEPEQVSFLFEANFSVHSYYEKPSLGIRFYRLTCPLIPVYGGDPYDNVAIAKWFVGSNLSRQELAISTVNAFYEGDSGTHQKTRLPNLTFEVVPSSLFTENDDEYQGSDLDPNSRLIHDRTERLCVSAQVVVVSDCELCDKRDVTVDTKKQLNIVLSTSLSTPQLNDIFGPTWKAMGVEQLDLYLGKLSSWALNKIPPECRGGLLIDLDSSFSDALSQGKEWTYFTPNGFGRNVIIESDNITNEDTTQFVLFASRGDRPELPFGGAEIWGCAKIASVYDTDYTGVIEEWKVGRTLVPPPEIRQSTLGFRGSIYPDVQDSTAKDYYGIRLSNTFIFATTVSIADFVSNRWCSDRVADQLRDYETATIRTNEPGRAPALSWDNRQQRLFPEPPLAIPEPSFYRIDYESRAFYLDAETCSEFAKASEKLDPRTPFYSEDDICEVFMSYRKASSQPTAVLLRDRIHANAKHLTRKVRVFLDTDRETGIKVGDELELALKSQVEGCRVFILLVGDDWAGIKSSKKGRAKSRINQKGDYVGFEVGIALQRLKSDETFKLLIVKIEDADFPPRDFMRPIAKLRDVEKDLRTIRLIHDQIDDAFNSLWTAIDETLSRR